jgi:hypothetical protein
VMEWPYPDAWLAHETIDDCNEQHCLLRNGGVVLEGERVVFVEHGFSGEVEE